MNIYNAFWNAFHKAKHFLDITTDLINKKDVLFANVGGRYTPIRLNKSRFYVPPGHFFSPFPSLDDIKQDEGKIFETCKRDLPGIEIHEEDQVALLKKFAELYGEMPFRPYKKDNLRCNLDNNAYCYSDVIYLYSMMRLLKPRNIIEVGSGFSSYAILDTNELFFNNTIATTFIEPYPELLNSLIKDKDKNSIRLIKSRLQDVSLAEFEKLKENDVIVIDSTHVSRTGSDVNFIFFEILPRIPSNVYIHFHDIFFPFEYPKEWVYEGRAWNEMYILRAFLQYNTSFRVMFMSTFMGYFYADFLKEHMPLCLKNTGCSIWIRKE